jgi:hypothetical protein
MLSRPMNSCLLLFYVFGISAVNSGERRCNLFEKHNPILLVGKKRILNEAAGIGTFLIWSFRPPNVSEIFAHAVGFR